MNIRGAGIDDLSAIVELGRESPTAAQWSEHTFKEILASTDKSRIALVAETDGSIVGFLLARCAADECELEDIVVLPSQRRQGIGDHLVRELASVARTRGALRVFLEVRESNRVARKFYENCGFTLIGNRRAYYNSPPENALLYVLDLP